MTPATPAGRRATPAELRRLLRHRAVGAALLCGEGLEIGALHYPLAVSGRATVDYLDVESAPTMRRLFPELDGEPLIEPRWIGDVVRQTVPVITGRRFDFIVMNHVLEHVANPIQVLANVWEGLLDGGLLALSVPDKHFTFDRARRLTSFEHLLAEFFQGVTTVDASHYVDLLEDVRPEVFADRERFGAALAQAAERREHAHVWDSDSFPAFWERSVKLLRLDAELVYESNGWSNRFEYFAVVRRARHQRASEDPTLLVLAALYRSRTDLQQAFPASEPALARRLLVWATTSGATIDSDAGALQAFQDYYRRVVASGEADQSHLEEMLRASLA